MPDRAQVSSVDALKAFRADLIVFLSKARPTLEEVSDEVMRTKSWLVNEQSSFWENQKRRRSRELERAQAELFSARISGLSTESSAQQMAVHKARRAVDEADAKLALLKRWIRDLDNLALPMSKQLNQLESFLGTDMSKAVAWLEQAVIILESYAGIHSPTVSLASDAPKAAPTEGSGSNEEGGPSASSASAAGGAA